MSKVKDDVNFPEHYRQGTVECIDAIMSAVVPCNGQEGYLVGNIIKYLFRYKIKGGKQSLEKANWYLQKLMTVVKE